MKKNSALTKTQNTILSAAFVLAVSSAINAVLGFLKNRLLAQYFGVSVDLAVFYTADRIPNLIYSLLILGAFSVVFIPTFTNLRKKNEEDAFRTGTAMALLTLVLFIVLGGAIYYFAPKIIELLAVGNFSSEKIILGTSLMRLMICAQFVLVAGSIATSILQSFKYFLLPALAPVFYNIGMILGIVLFSNKYGIYGPTYGVFIGSLLHFGIQLPLLFRSGFKVKIKNPFKDKCLKKALLLVPPRIAQVTITNLLHTVHNSFALLVSTSSVIHLKFASQLQFFPVSIFGISMASAALPTLSSQSDEKSKDAFRKSLYTSLHQMLYMVMPISALLFVLRLPAIRLVYGVSNFPWEDTIQTSWALAFFSISIFAQSANYILNRAFFALENTKTPVKISAFTAVINLIVAYVLTGVYGVGAWGIALAYSLTTLLDMILLIFWLGKKVGKMEFNKLVLPFVKISVATILMAMTTYIGLKFLDMRVIDTSKTLNLILLSGITSSLGLGTYFIFTKLFKVEEVELLYKLVRKIKLIKFIKSKKIPEIPQTPIN